MDLFTKSEAAVTETLLVLAAQKGGSLKIKLPHLVGQRYEALAQAVGPSGPFEKEGKRAAQALSGFRLHDQLRTHLAHGVFKVTLDANGVWHVISRVLVLRGGKEVRDVYVVDGPDGDVMLAQLEKIGGRLRSDLGQVRKAVNGSGPQA